MRLRLARAAALSALVLTADAVLKLIAVYLIHAGPVFLAKNPDPMPATVVLSVGAMLALALAVGNTPAYLGAAACFAGTLGNYLAYRAFDFVPDWLRLPAHPNLYIVEQGAVVNVADIAILTGTVSMVGGALLLLAGLLRRRAAR